MIMSHEGCSGAAYLRRNQLKAAPLAVLLALDEVEHLGVVVLEGGQASEGLSYKC